MKFVTNKTVMPQSVVVFIVVVVVVVIPFSFVLIFLSCLWWCSCYINYIKLLLFSFQTRSGAAVPQASAIYQRVNKTFFVLF